MTRTEPLPFRRPRWRVLWLPAIALVHLAPLVSAAGQAPGTVPAAIVPSSRSSAASITASTEGGLVRGTVVAGVPGKAGGVPLPGVAVTASHTLTGRKYATATDVDGTYTMQIPRNGRYVIRAELAGFAPSTVEVVLRGDTASAAATTSNLGLQLASRAAAAEARDAASASPVPDAGAHGSASLLRSLQGLTLNASSGGAEDASVSGGSAGAALPSLGAVGEATGNNAADTVAVTGVSGQVNGWPA